MRSHARIVLVSLLAGLLGIGCATSRGTLEVARMDSANPSQGRALRIAQVTDQRVFELAPASPSTPSLKDGAIHDKSITSRAIARKRNSFGQALGDILLPEGDTVERLVGESLTKGLRESGFRVLAQGDPGFEEATPLEVDIEKFWMWFSPGFWAVHMEFEGLVDVKGAVASFEDGEQFKGYARQGAQASTEGQWMKTLQEGLDQLDRSIVARLRGEPEPTPPAAQ